MAKPSTPKFQLIEHSRNVFEILAISTVNTTEIPIAFLSDVHWDSVHCDRNRLKRDLQEARKRGAIVHLVGDIFDFMQGRYDPRGHKSAVRPEFGVDNYFQEVLKKAAKWFAQFCKQMIISGGNHESNILKRQEIDVLELFATYLRAEGVEVLVGDYAGWTQVAIQRPDGGCRNTAWIQWHHGKGGGAKRSKGVLQVDLNQRENPDAHLSVEGHIHEKWMVPVTIRRINRISRKVSRMRTVHLQCGTYKQMNPNAGWEAEKGFFEPNLGGWFATFRRSPSNQISTLKLRVEDMEEELELPS